MARPVKATQWYEGSDGRMWHVEVGSKAEARLIMEGAEAVADPTVAAPEPKKGETNSGTPSLEEAEGWLELSVGKITAKVDAVEDEELRTDIARFVLSNELMAENPRKSLISALEDLSSIIPGEEDIPTKE